MTTPQERAAAYWQQLESDAAQDNAKAMRAFRVVIGKRGAARLDFYAMGESSGRVFDQHVDLAMELERVEVTAVGAAK